VRIGKWIGGLLSAVVFAAPAFAAYQTPVVITLDSIDYVSYDVAALDPVTSILSTPNASLSNCRRADNSLPASDKWRLHRSADTLDIDFASLRIDFNPTRLVLESSTHDIVCDGKAMGWQTGIGRVFRDDFDDA
jgi:hypothetical protein